MSDTDQGADPQSSSPHPPTSPPDPSPPSQSPQQQPQPADRKSTSPPKGDDKRRNSGGGGGKEETELTSPGSAYQLFQRMESLLEKLKVLGYDSELLPKSPAYKPVSPHYFAIASEQKGEQWFMFASVAAWLIQKAGEIGFEMPQEHDDPNAVIASILDKLKKTASADMDFPPSKLRLGAGEHCVLVLDTLADAAVKASPQTWCKPSPPTEDADEEVVATEEAELTVDQFDDEALEAADDEDDDILQLNLGESGDTMANAEVNMAQREILESKTDAGEWLLEVERVTPSLKFTIKADSKDWRGHLEQMQAYRTSMQTTLDQAGTGLNKLATEIGRGLEKIHSREKYLNQQLETVLSQFRSGQDRLAEAREKYKEASGGVTERSKKLGQITEELEQVKEDMESRGHSLTDGAPLVKIKQAINRLQTELLAMDVQIGVMERAMLQSQLRNRNNLQNDMYQTPAAMAY